MSCLTSWWDVAAWEVKIFTVLLNLGRQGQCIQKKSRRQDRQPAMDLGPEIFKSSGVAFLPGLLKAYFFRYLGK